MLQAQLKPTSAHWIHNSTSTVACISAQFLTNSIMFPSPVTFTNPVDTWILDSGATHHIYYSLFPFSM